MKKSSSDILPAETHEIADRNNPKEMGRLRERAGQFLETLAPFIALVGIWYVASVIVGQEQFLPSPVAVFKGILIGLVEPVGPLPLWGHMFWSLLRVTTAYIVGVSLGLTLGLTMGWIKAVEAIFKPLFEIVRPIPPLAWIPLAILWFGIGETPKIFIIFLAAFVAVTVNSYSGVKTVDPVLIGAARTLGAKDKDVFFEVVIPGALPAIFAGLQVGISAGWMSLLAAEMVRSAKGLGWVIIKGMENISTTQIVIGMVLIGISGFLLSILVEEVEKRVCPWRQRANQ